MMHKPARQVWGLIAVCAGLAILVSIVFGQTIHFSFVHYDDYGYVSDNPDVTGGLTLGAIAHAFEDKVLGLWAPLVTISHTIDWQLFGANAGGHHLSSVLIHLASTILLFLLLRQMTGALWRSAFVAAVFAIHPLHVESVAWIAERKDVLSGFFFMLTLAAYLHYVRRPGLGRYLGVVVLFAMGLMSKPMVVTLPVVLLLLDYWPLNRLFLPLAADAKGLSVNWRVVLEKIPLLALSAVSCVIAVTGPPEAVSVELIPFWSRMAEAPASFVIYLGELFRPVGLTLIYTHFESTLPWWPQALVLLVSLSAVLFILRAKFPYLWMGWLWNLVMLLPASGVVQISRHARADHYNYLPQIGLYIGLTWLVADWTAGWRFRRILTGCAAAAVLAALAIAAWRQTSYWRDDMTLWAHAIDTTRDNYFARVNYGSSLLQLGRTDEAIEQFREALRIYPAYPPAHFNLGDAMIKEGMTGEGISEIGEALRLHPDYAEAHYYLGKAFLDQRRTEEGIFHLQEAVRINPRYQKAHSDLGIALFRAGQPEQGAAELREAVREDPGDSEAHYNLAIALFQQKQPEQGIAELQEALKINPGYERAHYILGVGLYQEGRAEEAMGQFREALDINPADAQAHHSLAMGLMGQGQPREAIAEAQKALDLQPGNRSYQNDLAWMLATTSQQSLRDGTKALQLAVQASRSSGGNPNVMRTLAAAYAATGDFHNAVQTAQSALQAAEAGSNAELAGALRGDIKLYESGQPLRDVQ